MGALLRQETERFIDDVVWDGTAMFNQLMTAHYTFVNGPLASFYGFPEVTGDAFVEVERRPRDAIRRIDSGEYPGSDYAG